jgi:hypothetical protein
MVFRDPHPAGIRIDAGGVLYQEPFVIAAEGQQEPLRERRGFAVFTGARFDARGVDMESLE